MEIVVATMTTTTSKKTKWQKFTGETKEKSKEIVNRKIILMCISYCMIVVAANSY